MPAVTTTFETSFGWFTTCGPSLGKLHDDRPGDVAPGRDVDEVVGILDKATRALLPPA